MVNRARIIIIITMIINSWPLWMSRWLTAGCTRAPRPTKLARSVSGNLSHSCSVSKYEKRSLHSCFVSKYENRSLRISQSLWRRLHWQECTKVWKHWNIVPLVIVDLRHVTNNLWRVMKTYNMWQTASDLWSTTSRFFFFTAFSTRGGGCDPRNDQPPTRSSPPCPRSPPKVAQLLDSHAHQQSNPPLYYMTLLLRH